MTHTLHRRGTPASLRHDYVMFAMSAKGCNEQGSRSKLQRFLEIVAAFHPVNTGDMLTGNRFIVPVPTIIERVRDTSVVHAVFDDREALAHALRAVKEAELGVSVVVSGLFDEVRECCRQAGIASHTCETSLGIWGQTGRLPDEDILRFTTMCGHGQVSFNLVAKALDDLKRGVRSAREAAQELAKPCQCGVFNPRRAEAMLEEIACLWGMRVV